MEDFYVANLIAALILVTWVVFIVKNSNKMEEQKSHFKFISKESLTKKGFFNEYLQSLHGRYIPDEDVIKLLKTDCLALKAKDNNFYIKLGMLEMVNHGEFPVGFPEELKPYFLINIIQVVRSAPENSDDREYNYYVNLSYYKKYCNTYGGAQVGIYQSPTYNCQIQSFQGLEELLSEDCRLSDTHKIYALNAIMRMITHCYTGKKLFLFDIHQSVAEKLLKDNKSVILMNNYRSTNGSAMCLGLMNVSLIQHQ